MTLQSTDLVSLFERALKDEAQPLLEETGIVIQVGDNICKAIGLKNAVFGELINFDGGNQGIIMNLDEDYVSIFLLDASKHVDELETVKRTNGVFKVPVGRECLGRVLDALGHPIDSLGAITIEEHRPVESTIAGIVERSPVNESLETGILVIDALIPVGKGQRELIIGNRNTGKTSIALDTILHQKGKDVVCVYVSIGQRQAHVAQLVQTLEKHGALEYTVIVSSDAADATLKQYLAPYTGCVIAEYFRDLGHDVVIVYDDLTNHAIAYREMSLLMRRSPGREAYPGDVFYLHSRLLERAGKLAKGGSITAFPIVQVQGDDITAYIPTNLISITDGQIFLSSLAFNLGTRPAVNVELSVSRVGGAAQTKAMKKVTRALRLELAQYHELLDFAQFGSELDISAQEKLSRGARVHELLKQSQHQGHNFVDQVLMLYLLKENFLDVIKVERVKSFALEFVSYTKSVYSEVYEEIMQTKDLVEDVQKKLHAIAQEFSKTFIA